MIPYIPDFYSKADADALFEFCKSLPCKRQPNGHWGHSLKRRLSYQNWSVPYDARRPHSYGNAQPLDQMPPLYAELASRLSAYAGKPVNYLSTVGYEHERDGMNWHQHEEDKTREDQSVWVLSLGDEHLIGLREKGDVNKNNWECFYPAHGSLYVLPSAFNTTHEHAVLPDRFSRGLRIGINCKHIPAPPQDAFVLSAEAAGPKIYDCHKGKKYPSDGVYVGCKSQRGGKVFREGTIYGNGKNPFKGHYPLAAKTIAEFRVYAEKKMQDPAFRSQAIAELRNRDLLCWHKPDDPNCHARVWLEIVNRPEFAEPTA